MLPALSLVTNRKPVFLVQSCPSAGKPALLHLTLFSGRSLFLYSTPASRCQLPGTATLFSPTSCCGSGHGGSHLPKRSWSLISTPDIVLGACGESLQLLSGADNLCLPSHLNCRHQWCQCLVCLMPWVIHSTQGLCGVCLAFMATLSPRCR